MVVQQARSNIAAARNNSIHTELSIDPAATISGTRTSPPMAANTRWDTIKERHLVRRDELQMGPTRPNDVRINSEPSECYGNFAPQRRAGVPKGGEGGRRSAEPALSTLTTHCL